MADIDILVKKEFLKKAINVLLENNYSFKRFNNFKSFTINDNWSHQTPVIISPNGYAIDIHHRVTSPRKIKSECPLTKEIIDKPEYIQKYNSVFALPKPEHCFAHLAYSATYHDMFSSGPSIFYDIRDLIVYIKETGNIKEVNCLIENSNLNKGMNIILAMSRRMGIEIPFQYQRPPREIIDFLMDMIFMGNEISLLDRKFSINKFNYRLRNSIQSKYLESGSRIESLFRVSKVLIIKLIDFIKYLFFLISKPGVYKNYKIIKKYISSK